MKASSLAFPAAALMVLAGMLWGLIMGISEDHSTMTAHAHLNLLGWVSLFLIAVFYHLHPATDRSRIALAQVGIWIVGTVIMIFGLYLKYTGRASGEGFAAVGSLLIFAAALLFAWLVLRRNRLATSVPAE
jgi:cbb3-type cytochrome oxidase subunit 3